MRGLFCDAQSRFLDLDGNRLSLHACVCVCVVLLCSSCPSSSFPIAPPLPSIPHFVGWSHMYGSVQACTLGGQSRMPIFFTYHLLNFDLGDGH